MVDAQQVMPIFINGIARHSMDEGLNLPESIIADIKAKQEERKTLTARIPFLYYPMLLGVTAFLAILFHYPRRYS